MKHICLVSGGKDSQATAIWLKNNSDVFPTYVFCDTEWEDESTYKFIDNFADKLKRQIIRLRAKLSFKELAKKRKRFPSTMARFCTEVLKVRPMIDYILEQKEDILIYQGIRWEESRNRSSMEKDDDYFRYYFEPYGKDKKGKDKYRTYRKKEVVQWLKKYSCSVTRPIIGWTTKQVFEYILDNGFMPNELYKYGFIRVGCFPCIMCTKNEIAKIAEYRPEKIEHIKRLEVQMDSTFFPPDYIPARHCSKSVKKTNKITGEVTIVKAPTITDVLNYVRKKGYGSGFFDGSMCQNQMLPCE